MLKKIIIGIFLAILVTGCASVPMETKENDLAAKEFNKPADNQAGLYIYRNSAVGQDLKKNVYLNDVLVGETANKVFFYKLISPGNYKLSTESEFSDNSINFEAEGGKNYFVEQYIKMGVFVGGADLRIVPEEEGMAAVLKCNLAICN